MSAPTRSDEGAAAVEMAFVTVLMLAIFGFLAPLGVIFYESTQLGRNAADVIRFASSRPAQDRTVLNTTTNAPELVPAGSLPTDAQIGYEAARAVTGRTRLLALPVPVHTTDPSCPGGKRVTVTVRNEVDLGLFSAFIPIKVKQLSATATSCEE